MAYSYSHCNGFAMFIHDLQAQYNISFDEASHKAAYEWEELTEDKIILYNDRAMNLVSPGVDLTRKFQSDGKCLANVALKQMQESERRQIMLLLIEDKLQNLTFPENFLQEKFILCHVNYFYVCKDKHFKPAEIALCEFNLKNGVLRTFHKFIHPGTIELGYLCQAKEMETINGISIDDPNISFLDQALVYSLVKDFIKVDKKNKAPPLFTMANNSYFNYCQAAVDSTLKQLALSADDERVKFKVFLCDVLLYKILQKVDVEMKLELEKNNHLNYNKCNTWIENDSFRYCKKLACRFHEENDLRDICSLSVVKRWAFTICERVLLFMGTEPVKGCHIPNDSTVRTVWKRRHPINSFPKSSIEPSNDENDQKTTESSYFNSQRGRNMSSRGVNFLRFNKRGRGGVRGRQVVAPCNKSFTMEDYSSGEVIRVGSPERPKQLPSNPFKTQQSNEDSQINEGAYSGALRGQPSLTISLSDFPDLSISGKCSKCRAKTCNCFKNKVRPANKDVSNDLNFPPLGRGNPWIRGKK